MEASNVINAEIVKNKNFLAPSSAQPTDFFAELKNKGNTVNDILGTVSNILDKINNMRQMAQKSQENPNVVGDTQRVKTVTEVKQVEIKLKPTFNSVLFMQDLDNALNKLSTLPIPEKVKEITIGTFIDNKETFNVPIGIPILGNINVNYEFIKQFVNDWLNKNFERYLKYEN